MKKLLPASRLNQFMRIFYISFGALLISQLGFAQGTDATIFGK
jgi:hypothetical protein